jgi:membrane-bound metal-dependent hydrolase YbcI (DUF457 family)
MMLGHALLAFAVVALVAARGGWSDDRALALGALAGLFAAVPDADMVYAIAGPFGADVGGVFDATQAFWATSTLVHRTVTHSLVVAVPAAAAFAAVAWRRHRYVGRAVGATLGVALVTVAWTESGLLGGLVMAAFVASGLAVGLAAVRYTDFDASTVLAAALFGLASHPFGDVFTGEPPAFFYPLDATLLPARVVFSPDPTLHLLGAFAVELATVWLAVAVYVRLRQGDRGLRAYADRTAVVGAVYAVAVLVFPPPTLDVSYHFVFSILAVGTVVCTPSLRRAVRRRLDAVDAAVDAAVRDGLASDELLRAAVTGTTTVTVALAGYVVAYLAL